MKKLLVLLASLLIASNIFAQEQDVMAINQPVNQFTQTEVSSPSKFGDLGQNSIGVALLGGSCGIYGLEYERYFGGAFGLAFIGSGYANEYSWDKGSGKYVGGFNFSVMPELKLFHCEFAKGFDMTLFGWSLVGITAQSDWSTDYDKELDILSYSWDGWKINAVAGIGFGFDFVFAKHISVPVQFGFIGQFPTTPIVGMCVGTGIRFVW